MMYGEVADQSYERWRQNLGVEVPKISRRFKLRNAISRYNVSSMVHIVKRMRKLREVSPLMSNAYFESIN